MTRLGVFSEKRGQRRAIAMAGIARAASGGMLGTALAVYVGRDGSPLAVSMLATAFFLSTMVFAPFWGTLGDLIARRRPLLVLISIVITVFAVAFTLIDGVWGLVGLRGFYAVFAVGFSPLMLSIVGAIGGPER
ncbi:MAG: MFS transporter, partial [Halobacteriales archaeon]